MLIYKIPYDRKKRPNSMTDFMDFIKTLQQPTSNICLFILSPSPDSSSFKKRSWRKYCYIKFSPQYYDHFSLLLETYEARKLSKLPSFGTASPLWGDIELLIKT